MHLYTRVYTRHMSKAVRAIIIENGNLLVMHRDKQGSQYFTLVGGRVNEGETDEQALARELREETGLQLTRARLVYVEQHPAPYNEQYIYLCEVAPHNEIAIQEGSEEAFLNRLSINMHQPLWCTARSFEHLQFRTPQLHEAINKALRKGFPAEPVTL